jgi:hypothetical protein
VPRTSLHRRHVLRLLAGGAALAAGVGPGVAGEPRIARLIAEAAELPTVAERIRHISHALLGTPYRGFTLIGGPRQPEQFVARDDCFDCVTFCETVLAAARACRPDNFEETLRKIRYHAGSVEWQERNHYFSDWCEANIANGICRAVATPGGIAIDKPLSWMSGLGPRRASFTAIARAQLMAQRGRLATGDIIGFLSERPGLDYFHTGFIVVGDDGEVLLRHAAKSRRRVLDESLAGFLAANRVRRVTVLRPQEPWVENAVV